MVKRFAHATPWVFGLLCLAISSCAHTKSPFVVALPNGHYLERDKSSNIRIVKRNGAVVVKGPIAGYGADKYIVTGVIGASPPPGSSYANDTELKVPEGSKQYFVLDTLTGKLETGLDANAWKRRLEALGVKLSLGIRAPLLPT